jgi:hypothetical protein
MALSVVGLSVAAAELLAAALPDISKAIGAGGGVAVEGAAALEAVLADPVAKAALASFLAAL